MFKFIHAADIHLDSAREGVQRDDVDAPIEAMQQAPRRALENLVRLALHEQVAFVLIAGDLYDGNWQDFQTGLHFVKQVSRLADAGIRVVMISGNHDAANVMTRKLLLPETNVRLLSSQRPETFLLDDLGVAIHGQSFDRRTVEEDLAQAYPRARTGMFNIGLLHTSATYAAGEHDRYAPCSIETLLSKGYDYWALGHIHKRQDLRRSADEPPIIFPGNLQGRHIRETGAKGCLLVTVDDLGRVELQFRSMDVLRWELCRVDVAGVLRAEDVVHRVSDVVQGLFDESEGRPLALRIVLEGACAAHRQLVSEPGRWQAEIRAALLLLGSDRVWVEKIVRQTSLPRRAEAAVAAEGPLDELQAHLEAMRQDDGLLRELAGELAPLRQKLPADLTEGPQSLAWDDPATIRRLLDDAQQLLLQRLVEKGASE